MESIDPVVVLLSGGLNSTAAAVRVLDSTDTHLLFVDHGQAAAESETRAVRELSEALAAKLHIVKIPSPAELSAVVDNVGTLVDTDRAASGIPKSTLRLPGFMLTLLGLAVQLARRINGWTVICGASQVADEMESGATPGGGDPQLQHTFYHAAVTAIEMSSPGKRSIQLDTPFMDFSRPDIVQAGLRLGAPFQLSWSCHLSRQQPCNKCPGCISHLAAFDALGLENPATHPVR